jgi:PAS domain S-box-containing protein
LSNEPTSDRAAIDPLSVHVILPAKASPSRFEITPLQWAAGGFGAGLGTLILVVPHQFLSSVYAPFRPFLALWGALLLVGGMGLVGSAALRPRSLIVAVAHLTGAAAFCAMALGFLFNGAVPGFVNHAVLALGVVAAPILARAPRDRGGSIDVLSLVLGISAVGYGLCLVALRQSLGGPIFEPNRERLPFYGLALIVGGSALALDALRPTTPRARTVARLIAGAAFLLWLLAGTLQARLWSGVLYYGGFGLLLLLLPWLGPRLSWLDRRLLRSQLALSFVLLASVPLIGLVAWMTDQTERSIKAELLLRQQAGAMAIAQDVTDYLTLHRAAVIGVASLPGLLQRTPEEQGRILRSFDAAYPEITAWRLYSATGDPVAQSDELPFANVAGLPTFASIQQTGQPAATLQVARQTRLPVVVIGAPIVDGEGRFAGMVSATLLTTRLSEQLVRVAGAPDRRVDLVDTTGRAVARSVEPSEPLADLSTSPPVAAWLASQTSAAISYGPPEREIFAAYAPVGVLGWGVVLERQADVALAPSRQGREGVLLALLAVLAASVAAGAAFAERLTRPLRDLTRAARALAAGQAATPQAAVAIGELDTLAGDFERMRTEVLAREEALRASELRFRRIFESELIGMHFWDASGGIHDANDAFLRIIGYSREDLSTGRINWAELTPPEHRGRDERALAEIAARGASTPFEKEYVREDGSRVPVLIGAVSLAGERSHGVAFVLDIEERKRYEQAQRLLAEAGSALEEPLAFEDRLTALAALVLPRLADIAMIDLVEADGSLRRAAGLHHDAAKQALLDQYQWRYPADVKRSHPLVQVAETGVSVLYSPIPDTAVEAIIQDEQHRALYEALAPHSAMVVPLSGRDRVLGVLTLTRVRGSRPYDRADLALAEEVARRASLALENSRLYEELEQEREQLQRIIDTIPVMITIYQPDTRVIRLNPEFERVTGWSTEAAREVDLMAACYPDPIYREQIREFMQSLQPGWREITMTTRDGRTVETVWANVRLANDAQIGIGLDITERKQLEQLQRQFIANVSHELRNPLASIHGFAQLTQRRESYDPRTVEAILNQTRLLDRLIGDLLEVSRLESGALELRREPVDLVAVARAAVEDAQATSDQHTVRLEARDGAVVGSWDLGRLRQVFSNLLGNAIKYSPEGGEVVVAVATSGPEAEVSIRDHGLGIARQQLPRLFDRFYRVGPVATGVQGLGLGLHITRELIQALGGRIWAESEGLHRGSTFCFTLPLE